MNEFLQTKRANSPPYNIMKPQFIALLDDPKGFLVGKECQPPAYVTVRNRERLTKRHAKWVHISSYPVFRTNNLHLPEFDCVITSKPYRREEPKPLSKRARRKLASNALQTLRRNKVSSDDAHTAAETIRLYGSLAQRAAFDRI